MKERLMTTYPSKRNTVLGDGVIVEKRFSDLSDYKREKEIVECLLSKGVPAPKILSFEKGILRYSHIKGTLYTDIAECMEEKHAKALVYWLSAFYNATNLLRGDNNLRNYIFCDEDNSCIGIDFESKEQKGSFADDCGQILAFIATNSPSFSDNKQKSCLLLLREYFSYEIDGLDIEQAFIHEINAMQRRRKNPGILEKAKSFYEKIKDELFFEFGNEVEEKILSYSKSTLVSFFYEMEGVWVLANNIFGYKNVRLRVTDLGEDTTFRVSIPRSRLEIAGSKNNRQEFYMKFLVNYMTMGG